MSVAYRVQHTTRFEYPVPVTVCQNTVCLTPRPDPRLTIEHASLKIEPQPTIVTERADSFGNVIHVFSIEEAHASLCVHAVADLVVHDPAAIVPGPAWEQLVGKVADQTDAQWMEVNQFLYDSPLVNRSASARDYAARAFTPGRPVIEAALGLTHLIHDEFEYLPGTTHVGTHSGEAIASRRGVCQDFAHAQAAMLRSIGLPARYVSGYLRTSPPPGKPKLVGIDQSHAWVSVYAGDAAGWVDLDPTNRMACGTDHIPVAFGRDYADVAPVRGAFLGGGESRLTVTVDVALRPAKPVAAEARAPVPASEPHPPRGPAR